MLVKKLLTMLFMFTIIPYFLAHYYWLDCSHPSSHPIATIATDGAAGASAPGNASLVNGRLRRPPLSFPHGSPCSSTPHFFWPSPLCWLYDPTPKCMPLEVVNISLLLLFSFLRLLPMFMFSPCSQGRNATITRSLVVCCRGLWASPRHCRKGQRWSK